MKKNISPLLFGAVFILAGLAYLSSAIFDFRIDIFFDGWWTLFILVPTFISILSNGPRIFNCTAFVIGGILLLQELDIINVRYTGAAIVGTVIVAIGVSLIVKYFRNSTVQPNYSNQNCSFTMNNESENADGQPVNQTININTDPNYQYKSKSNYAFTDYTNRPTYTAILSGVDTKNSSQDFDGASISAILGGVDLDLRDAVVTHDVTIYVSAVMGGVDIFAPRNVRLNVKKTDIMGGTSCQAYCMPADSNAPIVNFVCTTVMGGIDIK